MKKKLDSIYEAYMGDISREFTRNVRTRVHWICKEAAGDSVLDVGCSQGITSILLGREGKTVFGLDVEEESIRFANNKLSTESADTQKNISFITGNFLNQQFEKKHFDTVILTEVLEHVVKAELFLEKADTVLSENGKLIVTVPFGINDFWDHKETYYLTQMFEMLGRQFDVEKVEFFTKWIGFVCVKKGKCVNPVILDLDLLKREEESFFNIERTLIDRNSRLQERLEKKQEVFEEELTRCKDKIECYGEEVAYLQEERIRSTFEKNDLEIMVKHLQNTIESKKAEIESKKAEIESLKKSNLDLNETVRKCGNDIQHWQKKYNDLANSKLGRLTIKIWTMRK